MLAHSRVYRADKIANHRIVRVGPGHVLERRIGAIQLTVTDEQLGELRPCGRMIGLQPGHRPESAERSAPIAHLEGDEADEEVAFDEIRLNPENLPAVVARLLNLSTVQRLEPVAGGFAVARSSPRPVS
jgi:hypothetical protein